MTTFVMIGALAILVFLCGRLAFGLQRPAAALT